jgi:transcriptional regulator with XRE-family HTH domain
MATEHIGSLIKQKVRERGLSNTEFAKAIHCSRTNVISIFKRESINVKQLKLISDVLGYDFFEIYSEKKNKTPRKHILIVIKINNMVKKNYYYFF